MARNPHRVAPVKHKHGIIFNAAMDQYECWWDGELYAVIAVQMWADLPPRKRRQWPFIEEVEREHGQV